MLQKFLDCPLVLRKHTNISANYFQAVSKQSIHVSLVPTVTNKLTRVRNAVKCSLHWRSPNLLCWLLPGTALPGGWRKSLFIPPTAVTQDSKTLDGILRHFMSQKSVGQRLWIKMLCHAVHI